MAKSRRAASGDPAADGCANGFGLRRGSARGRLEKASRLLGDIAEIDETAALADHVEEIAMFGRGGIGPMPGGAGTGFRPAEPDEHRPAGRIANVAHRPVAALPPPVGQVMAATASASRARRRASSEASRGITKSPAAR